MMRFTAITLCLLVSAALAFAHGDDDHAHDDAPAAAVLATGVAPRLEAVGSEIELVATVADRQLTIFLDRQATNEPIDGATIAVTADGIPAGTAKALGAGAYVLPAPWADEPGVKPLKFAITVGSRSSALEGKLDVGGVLHAAPSTAIAWHSLLEQPLMWVLSGLAAVLGFVVALAFRPARRASGAALIQLAADAQAAGFTRPSSSNG